VSEVPAGAVDGGGTTLAVLTSTMSTSITMKAVKDSDDLFADQPSADASAGRHSGARQLRCRCQIVNGEISFIWYVTGAGRVRSL
jgi:hypothetical protein